MSGKIKPFAMPKVDGESQKADFNSRPMTAGNIRNADYPPVKTSGTKMRGAGAATKGTMCRGPMA